MKTKHILTLTALEDYHKEWSQTTRGLTEAGTAVVAITAAAIAAPVAAKAGAFVGKAAGGAVGTMGTSTTVNTIGVIASSAASAATNAAITSTVSTFTVSAFNNQGNLGRALKQTTDKDSLENIAISAAAAGLTAGVVTGVNIAIESVSQTNLAVNNANSVNTTSSTLDRITNNLQTSFKDVAIQTASSSATQSLLNGDSFTESLQNQFTNAIIYTAAKVAANEIGRLSHGKTVVLSDNSQTHDPTKISDNIITLEPAINKTTQLVLHAGLGAGVAALTNNNIAAGAVSGVVGELVGDALYQNGQGLDRKTTIETSKIIGAITSVSIAGSDDSDAVFLGSQLAGNAVENNLTMFVHGTNSGPKHADKDFLISIGETFNEKAMQLDWSPGGNNKQDRSRAANIMNEIISNYNFTEGEQLNIIDHSHGGNVTKEFTQLYNGNKKIDTLVFLGTPHRVDYKLDYSDLSHNNNLINIYDKGDWIIQPFLGAGLSGSLASQELQGALNVPILQTEKASYYDWKSGQIINSQVGVGWIDSHSNLDSRNVWESYVKPNLK